MNTRNAVYIALLLILVLPPAVGAQDDLPPCTGVLGIDSNFQGGWLAVRVAIPDGQALAGFQWFNNDGLVVFPSMLVGTGYATAPGNIEQMTPLHEAFSGASNAWSTLDLDQPVAASQGALYVTFEFPEGAHYSAEGAGGGPAIGFWSTDAGAPGWISGDGESWLRLAPQYSFAIVPEFVPADDTMLVKSLHPEGTGQETPAVLKYYFTAGPNPFNPSTEFNFGLVKSQEVDLSIYDLRGYRVRTLASGHLQAGPHTVAWRGRDDSGRAVASGVYFARLHGTEVDLKTRLVLLK